MLDLPGTARWRDVRIAASEYDYRGEPLEYEVARLRAFVTTTRRCLWHHVRTGDALSLTFERRRYSFEVTQVEAFPAFVELVPNRATASQPSSNLVCRRG